MKCLRTVVSDLQALHRTVEYSPDIRHNDRALRDEVPLVHVVLFNAVRCTEWGSRAPSDDLLEHCGKVWESVTIRQRWQAVVTDDRVDLSLAFALHLRVGSHSKEEGGHSRDGLQGDELRRALSMLISVEILLRCRRRRSIDLTQPI